MPIIQNDFSKVTTLWGGMRRCLVLDDHTVNYYLDVDDSTKKEDGSPAGLTGADGQVMVEIPKFYFKKEVDGDKVIFMISDEEGEGLVLHPAFYRDRDGDGVAEEVDYRYMSAFMGCDEGGKLVSLPHKGATANMSIGNFRNLAQARGTGWGIVDYNLIYAIQMLYITEFGHPDSQTMIGRGYVDGNAGYAQTGSTIKYGNNSFGETTGKQQMSYRGIEDFYGNYYYWIDGIVSDGSRNILLGDVDFNNVGDGYRKIITGTTADLRGNIIDIHDDQDLGFLIGGVGGSHETDGLHDYGDLRGGRVAYFGGFSSLGSAAGAFLLRLHQRGVYTTTVTSSRLVL